MLYILLSVCCSLLVSILLKLARRYHIDVLQAITWNYSIAIALTWLFFKPHIGHALTMHGETYTVIGILLPVLFLIIATSVKFAGIIRTDVAQRLSLLIPVIASFLLFTETPGILKIAGTIIGFAAMLCAIPWGQKSAGGKANSIAWLYLLIVFVGMGIIDVIFKQIALFKDINYTSSLFVVFIISFVVSLVILAVQISRKKTKFSFPHILIGWVLGLVNFGNIVFYIKAHQALARSPLTVFATVNIGVIVTGAIVGFAVFKEKLSLVNKIGIGLALVAIIIIGIAGV